MDNHIVSAIKRENYTFYQVLRCLNDTNRKYWFYRKGWNGDGQTITYSWDTILKGYNQYPIIEFQRKDHSSIPWTPTNADIFAEDWELKRYTSTVGECEVNNKFTFVDALQSLINGHALYIHRSGWNGKNMKVKMQVPDEHSKMTTPYLYIEGNDFKSPYNLPQSDLLADDWVIAYKIEKVQSIKDIKFKTFVELIYEDTLDMKFIRCEILDIMGMGETEDDALDDLKDELEFTYKNYVEVDPDTLSCDAKALANVYIRTIYKVSEPCECCKNPSTVAYEGHVFCNTCSKSYLAGYLAHALWKCGTIPDLPEWWLIQNNLYSERKKDVI